MLSTIARLVNPRKRRHAAVPLRSPLITTGDTDDKAERRLARSLAEALDDALGNNRAHQLRALVESSQRIAHRHPQLTERVARMRFSAGDAAAALSLIDACTTATSSLRLLRCACLIAAGRRTEAHQELFQWCQRRAVPIDARLMLALLEWDSGDIESASAALRENLRQLDDGDERTLMLSLCLAVERGHHDRAAEVAVRLRQCCAGRMCVPDVDVLMATLGLQSPAPATHLTDPQLEGFVTELIAAEATIPALVESLELRRDRSLCIMLADALERAVGELRDMPVALEALARLRLLLGERDEALSLIERGLAINPMSAALARLQRSLTADAAADRSAAQATTVTPNDAQRSKAA